MQNYPFISNPILHMNKFLITKIQETEFDEVTRVLTDAFLTNPAYSIIFKDPKKREAGLLWLFRTSLFLLNRKQALTNVVKERETGKIIGTFTVVPPEGVKKGFGAYLKVGIPGFIINFGMSSLSRMLSMDDYNKQLLTDAMGTSAYYYLSMVVIRHEYRGTGIGTYAIRYAIEELTASGPACKLMGLTTQLPENVIFYSRLGFTALDDTHADFRGYRYFNCNMKLDLSPDKIQNSFLIDHV